VKRSISLGLTLALLAGWTATAGAQEVKNILAKMIEAQGGRKALESVRTSTAFGTLELVQMGLPGSITISQKEPDKMRIDIDLAGLVIIQAFDGAQAWMTDPQSGTSQEMPEALGKNMKRQAMGSDALLNPKKAGIAYTAMGKETIGDKDCYVLEQAFADGLKATLYIDASSGLVLRSKAKSQDPMSGADIDEETVFEDFRKVGGTVAAYKMVVFQNGAEYLRMTISKIEPNAALDDAFFKMVR
jgi:outer membrane lipoprotein-sorting protein